jgi:hypothetical protein
MFFSTGQVIQNTWAVPDNRQTNTTTSQRASTGFLEGKKSLFFGSDGTFKRSVSIIKS